MTISDETKARAAALASSLDCDVYFYNGPINEDGVGAVVEASFYQRSNALLILNTLGGSANSAYRISRFFQSVYKRFSILIPSYCKSAGTLITLGAHQLIMTEFAELGPLDVQLVKRDEIGERRSGLLLRSALTHLNEHSMKLFSHLMLSIKTSSRGLIRFKLASELAAEMTKGLLSPIYCQVTAETLGQDHQDLMVAYEYGKRLAAVGGLIDDKGIYDLVHDYPSHDFVIDRLEAKKLFKSVDDPSEEMYELLAGLGVLAWRPNERTVTVLPLSKSDEAAEEGREGAKDQAGDGPIEGEAAE